MSIEKRQTTTVHRRQLKRLKGFLNITLPVCREIQAEQDIVRRPNILHDIFGIRATQSHSILKHHTQRRHLYSSSDNNIKLSRVFEGLVKTHFASPDWLAAREETGWSQL